MKKINILMKIVKTIYSHEYNRQRPLYALYRNLKWYLMQFLKRKEFYDIFWGYKMKFWLTSNQSLWLYRNYIMDWNEFKLIERLVKPGDVVFDIGSNIGVYSLWFSKCLGPNGTVFAFEPNKENTERLKETILLNGIQTIRLDSCAVSDIDGKLYFTDDKDNENQIVSNSSANTIEVDSVRLDSFCQQKQINRIHYLKIDVEGAEFLVFKGAENLLKMHLIDVIQFEINNQIKKFNIEPADIINYLASFGYHLFNYDVSKNILKKFETKDLNFEGHSNYFALANQNEVIKKIRK